MRIAEWQGLPPAQFPQFIDEHWQRQPLLIRGLLTPAECERYCALEPSALLELACAPSDTAAYARLIERDGGDAPLRLTHGPLDLQRLRRLNTADGADGAGGASSGADSAEGASSWNVLVRHVDEAEPSVEALLTRFDGMIPRWRIDDVMVSLSPAGAGIGAHLDNYDVFLLQGRGERRWEIEASPRPPTDEQCHAGMPVRVLTRFDPSHTWTLRPGDALYLPPRIPHRGTSLGPGCMTYSVGFRTPSHSELLISFAEMAATRLPEADHLHDPEPASTPFNRGRIGPAVVAQAREVRARSQLPHTAGAHTFPIWQVLTTALSAALADDEMLTDFIGGALTARPHKPPIDSSGIEGISDSDASAALEEVVVPIRDGEPDACALRHAEGSKFAFIERDGGVSLFVRRDGATLAPPPGQHLLCSTSRPRGTVTTRRPRGTGRRRGHRRRSRRDGARTPPVRIEHTHTGGAGRAAAREPCVREACGEAA